MARRECRRISFEDDALDAGDRPNTSLLGKHNFDKPTSKSTLIYYLSRTLILMVSLASIMLFVMGLQWRLGANKQCLAMHSTYCMLPISHQVKDGNTWLRILHSTCAEGYRSYI